MAESSSFVFFLVFTARCYAERGIAMASRLSVCLSVCLSVYKMVTQVGILGK